MSKNRKKNWFLLVHRVAENSKMYKKIQKQLSEGSLICAAKLHKKLFLTLTVGLSRYPLHSDPTFSREGSILAGNCHKLNYQDFSLIVLFGIGL